MFAGSEGFTSNTSGTWAMLATGAMSRMKSKLRLSYSVVLIRIRRTYPRQRVTIRGRPDDGLGREGAAGAWPIFNDERPAEPLRQPLAH